MLSVPSESSTVRRSLMGILELSRVSLILFAFSAINLAIAVVDSLAPVDISVEYSGGALKTLVHGSPSGLGLEIALSIVSAVGFAVTVASYFPVAIEVLVHELGEEGTSLRELCTAAVIAYLVSIASGIAGYTMLATRLDELAKTGTIALGFLGTVLGGIAPIALGILGDLLVALILIKMRRIFSENMLLLAALLLVLTNLYPDAYPLAWLALFFSLRRVLVHTYSKPSSSSLQG